MLVYLVPAIGLTLIFAAIMAAIKAETIGNSHYNIVAIVLLAIGLPLSCTIH